jgi:transcriptional regulator with XRE-family HTH domain
MKKGKAEQNRNFYGKSRVRTFEYVESSSECIMSEASVMYPCDALYPDMPLSVLLLYTAMSRDIPLSEFALELGVGALSLRQFIAGQAQRPRGRTLELLSEGLDMPVEEIRRRAYFRPMSAPRFSDWFKERMNGRYSRAKLTKETNISDGALRNYLSGQTLPDTHQAKRLAKVFGVDDLELAQILAADHLVRSGGEPVPAPESGDQEFGTGEFGYRFAAGSSSPVSSEEQLFLLWRKLHPHGRRATLNYIAALLAEE